MDMIIETGSVPTNIGIFNNIYNFAYIEELDDIVAYFISQGLSMYECAHKYFQYLLVARAYKVKIDIWKEYTTQVLINLSKAIKNKFTGLESIHTDMSTYLENLKNLHKHLTKNEDEKLNECEVFEKYIDVTFSKLEGFMNDCKNQDSLYKNRVYVFRPILMTLLSSKFSFNKLLKANEFYTKLIVNEMIAYGYEDEDLFKSVFLKLGFNEGLMPWSVFKGMKNDLKSLKLDTLYFYITKYFMDTQSENEEICEYIFTTKEYKDIIKHFLDNSEDYGKDSGIKINEMNETEFDGFVLID